MGAARHKKTKTMPELLDSELEAAMRSLLFWLIVPLFVMGVLCIVEPAYAFEIPFTDIKILEPEEPIINEAAPVVTDQMIDPVTSEPPLVVERTVEDKGIVDSVTRIIGINKEGKRNITVMFEGKELGVIQEGSKFENVPIHKKCLTDFLQYGSDQWYACEVKFL
jgi:hypothetical protein